MNGQPTRDELIERIIDALENAPYISLLIACQAIEYGQTKE